MKRTISVLVEKDAGGLARIISLLTRRRFQIESITIGQCERKYYERIIIVLTNQKDGSDHASQLTKQLRKLLHVVNVEDITYIPSIHRELLLIKIQINVIERVEIFNIAKIFRFKIIEVTNSTIILEVTADNGKIAALQKILEKYKILQLVRTGEIALTRESSVDINSLREFPESEINDYQNYRENIDDLFQTEFITKF
uniref:acetolactate synthase small subunit n=1 Tax=Cutleria multifida TaxID=74475 RepID=UPI002E77E868|nr:acetolactate synthase small subunit [Cutleria multifida]WAM62634.1 acetolactate synthase small subunit [Cutleria multifida]